MLTTVRNSRLRVSVKIQQLYMVEVLWRLIELWVLVWLEVVVVLTDLFFLNLKQQHIALLVKSSRDMKHEHEQRSVIWSVWGQAHLTCSCFSEWFFPAVTLDSHTSAYLLLLWYWRRRKRHVRGKLSIAEEWHECGFIQLMNLHNLCLWTVDTWVVYEYSLDDLWVGPADITITLASTRSVAWLSCRKKRCNIISSSSLQSLNRLQRQNGEKKVYIHI